MELITVNEAMRLLSLGRTTIYRLIDEGTLQSVTIGKARRILKDSVHRLCEKGDA